MPPRLNPGVFLFNLTTDDLDDGSPYIEQVARPEPLLGEPEISDDHEEAVGRRRGWGGSESLHSIPEDHDHEGPADDVSLSSIPDITEERDRSLPSEPVSFHAASSPAADCDPPTFSPSPLRSAQIMDVTLDQTDFNPRMPRPIFYSSEGDLTPLPEPTATCLGVWLPKLVAVNKYVDDNLQEECLNFKNAEQLGGGSIRRKQAVSSQNAFRPIVKNAERKSMKVNTKKTGLLCISDSLNYKTHAYIQDKDGEVIENGDKLKVLGWHFSSRPTVAVHIETVKRRFRERYWTFRHLKHNGFSNEDLVKVYTAIIRPVAEYMAEAYHSMLTDAQDEALERLQVHALRCIFSPALSRRRLRQLAGIQTLRDRRIELCDAFALKCVRSERFSDWFPEVRARRSGRSGEVYVEHYARCKRLYDSPIYYMRRRLNKKPGKTYGARNREYRE